MYFAQDITQNLSHIANKVTPCPVSHTGPATGQVSLSLGIQKVQIGVINNVTTSQPPATAYNYYPSPIADVGIGNTSILTVTYYTSPFGGTSGQIGVWVDWNEDGDFLDTNEFIKVQPTTSVSGSIYTFNIMPTVGTAPGKKRLRIRTESTTRPTLTAINSCGALVYGETEDYDLIVTDVPENITFYDYNSPSQLSFNNSRSNIPKPIFRISHETVTATKYEVEINTDPSFVATPVTTYIHTAALPVNTPKDVSLASATLSLNNGTTYYVRARAYSSLNFFGLWSQSRYSFTYNTSYPVGSRRRKLNFKAIAYLTPRQILMEMLFRQE